MYYLQEALEKFDKVTRPCWKQPEAYLTFKNGKLVNHLGKFAILGKSSFSAKDWVEWTEATYTVKELLEKLVSNSLDDIVFFKDLEGNRIIGHICVEKQEKTESLGALFG